MRIAIIGAGSVGQALAQGWSKAGHAVKLGVPNPKAEKYRSLPASQLTTPAAAAADAEIIVLATPWPKTVAAIGGLGNLAGRIVVDCTNPLTSGPQGMVKVRPAMFVAGDDAAKKPAVLKLVSDLGFEAVDAGPLANARLLEPFAMLWIDQALVRGRGPDFAFALVKRG